MLSLTHENKKVSVRPCLHLMTNLEPHCRFDDLQRARIAESWQQLKRLQEFEDFPLGRLLGPNSRVWTVNEVKQWLATRPTERKVIPPRKKQMEVA